MSWHVAALEQRRKGYECGPNDNSYPNVLEFVGDFRPGHNNVP